MRPIWILVNCNSKKEAEKIGREILGKRLVSCFDIVPRLLAGYFWPPKSGKIETAKGATLIFDTFKNKYAMVAKEVNKIHSDKIPFIGYFEIKGVSKEYINWMKGEIN